MERQSVGMDSIPKKAGILYHYTTQSGLLGIPESKSIWGTHAAHLNDSSEFKRGLDIVQANLKSFTASSFATKIAGGMSQDEATLAECILERARGALAIVDELDVFVSSFFDEAQWSATDGGADAGDALNQWRAYSRGEAGFSIGFDKALLSQHIIRMKSDGTNTIEGDSCNYDEGFQSEYLRERVGRFSSSIVRSNRSFLANYAKEWWPGLLEQLRTDPASAIALIEDLLGERSLDSGKEFEQKMKNEFRRLDREIIRQLADIMIRVAFMKHSAFTPENEWRIVFFLFRPTSRVKFRASASSLVPYVEIPLPLSDPGTNLIRRIVVGPSPKIEAAVLATKMLLRGRGYSLRADGHEGGVEVAPSKLPFRSW
jgi:hypothetical protein